MLCKVTKIIQSCQRIGEGMVARAVEQEPVIDGHCNALGDRLYKLTVVRTERIRLWMIEVDGAENFALVHDRYDQSRAQRYPQRRLVARQHQILRIVLSMVGRLLEGHAERSARGAESPAAFHILPI